MNSGKAFQVCLPSSCDTTKRLNNMYIVLTGDLGHFICLSGIAVLHRVTYNLRRLLPLQWQKKKINFIKLGKERQCHITKQLMHSFSVYIRICQPENSDLQWGRVEVNTTFDGWLILMFTSEECINCILLYDSYKDLRRLAETSFHWWHILMSTSDELKLAQDRTTSGQTAT